MTGFIVEMAKTNAEWERITPVSIRAYEYLAEGLTKNEMIKFRVIAVNEAGQSEPAVQDDYVCVKELTEDPVIDIDSTNVTLKSGLIPNRRLCFRSSRANMHVDI